jgi:4-hydroxy-tetrahydrodipicolinate reductase
VVGEREPIVLEHVTRLVDDIAPHWPQGKGYRAIIEGEPRMEISMDMADRHGDHAVGGVIQTATRIVNAIPAVVEHPPGLVSALDLPMITARGLYRPEAV